MLHDGRAVVATVVLFVVGFQLDRVKRKPARALAGDAAFVSVGVDVDRTLPSNAVLLSMFHSGSLRHYAWRLSLRYDWLDPAWWPRALDVLRAESYRPYVATRSAGRARPATGVGRTSWPPRRRTRRPRGRAPSIATLRR
jgi:hypothetical protein